MHQSVKIIVLALAFASVVGLCNAEATASGFKVIHPLLGNNQCVEEHSSPSNVGTAMGLEIFEFSTPAADAYRCCISQNSTGQDLYLRMVSLTGSILATAHTPVNGALCAPFVNLDAPFVYHCTVGTGAGHPVLPSATGHYTLTLCRQ